MKNGRFCGSVQDTSTPRWMPWSLWWTRPSWVERHHWMCQAVLAVPLLLGLPPHGCQNGQIFQYRKEWQKNLLICLEIVVCFWCFLSRLSIIFHVDVTLSEACAVRAPRNCLYVFDNDLRSWRVLCIFNVRRSCQLCFGPESIIIFLSRLPVSFSMPLLALSYFLLPCRFARDSIPQYVKLHVSWRDRRQHHHQQYYEILPILHNHNTTDHVQKTFHQHFKFETNLLAKCAGERGLRCALPASSWRPSTLHILPAQGMTWPERQAIQGLSKCSGCAAHTPERFGGFPTKKSICHIYRYVWQYYSYLIFADHTVQNTPHAKCW